MMDIKELQDKVSQLRDKRRNLSSGLLACGSVTREFVEGLKRDRRTIIPHTRLQIPVRGSMWGLSGIGHPDVWDTGVGR
jgi:hypothetical protein